MHETYLLYIARVVISCVQPMSVIYRAVHVVAYLSYLYLYVNSGELNELN